MKNTADFDREKRPYALVGRLIKAYREEKASRMAGGRLTQRGLINLMSDRGEVNAYGRERSSVSQWERGKRRPPREFLLAFGRVLDIPGDEIDLLLTLAGYGPPAAHEERDRLLAAVDSIESRLENAQIAQEDSPDHEERDRLPAAVDSIESRPENAQNAQEDSLDHEERDRLLAAVDSIESRLENAQADSLSRIAPGPSADDAYAVVRSSLRKAALPGVYALAVGFMLNGIGLSGTAVVLAYALAAASLVTGQWTVRWLKPARSASEQETIADLFFISLFVTLNTPVLTGAFTKADHFGFYTLWSIANTATPFVLMILANLALSLAGTVIFGLLQRRQYGLDEGQNAFVRAVWITLPPLLFVYANIIIFTNMGACLFFIIVFGVLFGAFTAIIALNEPGLKLGNDGFVLKATIVVIILLCASGVAGMLMGYMEPDIVITAADLRVIPLSPEALGYTPEEEVERLRLGILWMSLATIAYLAVVVGGYLIMTVRRTTSYDPDNDGLQSL